MLQIRTERLLLRPAHEADLDAMHSILRHPDAMAYWSEPPHSTIDRTREWLNSMIGSLPPTGEDFIVEHQGQVIGKAGFHAFPEIGYILHPDWWGHGFAREALSPVIRRAFDVHQLDYIEADVDPRNAPSLRLLEKLNFQEVRRQERTWNVGGTWCDSVYLRLLRN